MGGQRRYTIKGNRKAHNVYNLFALETASMRLTDPFHVARGQDSGGPHFPQDVHAMPTLTSKRSTVAN